MKYRRLGNTNVIVSEIGFGTIPILSGNIPVLPHYFNLDNKTAIEIMQYAFKLGCNLFDTAIVPEYGDAEIKLGEFAASIDRNKIVISDKARFFNGDEMFCAVEKSYKNLGTYADIYFVHQVDEQNADKTFEKGGAVDALNEMKAIGKIKYAGIASHYYDILFRGVKDKRIDILQGSGNILERGMLERIQKEPLFRQKGFFLNKVYAAGILPSFFSLQELLSGVLFYPISSALIGLGTKEQIDSIMKLEFQKTAPLKFSQVLLRLEKDFIPICCDRCQRCKCIYGIEIHTIFRQYNYYFLGKDYWALKKLTLNIKESAEQCKKCIDMLCIKQCPYNINIPKIMLKVNQLVKVHTRNNL